MDNKYPATFVGRVSKRYDDGWTTLAYKYRGETYLVDVPHNGYTTAVPLKVQHQQAQARIDAKLDLPEPEPKEYTGAVEKALDKLWESFEEEVQ